MNLAPAPLTTASDVSVPSPASEGGGAALQRASFRVGGIHCAACADLIEAALLRTPGVVEAQVNGAAARAYVRWDPQTLPPQGWQDAVSKAGYQVLPDQVMSGAVARKLEARQTLWRLFVTAFLAMQVMMMATPSYVAAPGELSPDLRQLLNWGSWVLSLPALGFGAGPFYRGAWRALRLGRLSMDVAITLGLSVTLVASTIATFDPRGPLGEEVWFDSLTMFLAFLWLARWLEMRARHRNELALETWAQSLPQTAKMVDEQGRVHEVAQTDLQVGQTVRVGTGLALPADGVLLSGEGMVSEALISGESSAIAKTAGDAVLAGSRNLGSTIDLRVSRVGEGTRQAQIVALMREALSRRPSGLRWADRWAGPFVAAVSLLALAGAAWHLSDPARAWQVAVAVLIVTCPCALTLAVPSALVAAASGLARQGVLLRRLEALEALPSVDTVVFDKTGTVTEDRLTLSAPQWLAWQPFLKQAEAAWGVALQLAQHSVHPVSRALVAAAHDDPARVESELQLGPGREHPGQGVEAQDASGRRWRWGRRSWAKDRLSAEVAGVAEDNSEVCLACDGEVVARWAWQESMRPDALPVMQALQRQGLHLQLLSGDVPARVRAIAQALGVEDWRGGQTPEDKLTQLASLRSGGRQVMMVGDGLNDGPVLGAAHVSLAVDVTGSDLHEAADAVQVRAGLAGAWVLHQAGLMTARVIRQNLFWALSYNLVMVPLAVMGWLTPWVAGLGMALSSMLVVLNAQRAGRCPEWSASSPP